MDYKPGTDGYKQAKNVRTFCIISTIVTIAVASVFIFPFGGYLHADFKRANLFWNIAAVVSTAASVFVNASIISKILNDEVSAGKWINVVTVGWLVLNILLFAGFDFSIG